MSRKRLRRRKRYADFYGKQDEEIKAAERAKAQAEWDDAVKDMKRIAKLPSFMPTPSK